MKRVFLTGTASLVGAEILRALLRRHEVHSIGLLMPADEAARTQALQRLEAFTGPLPLSVRVITGDMRLPRFGFSMRAWNALAASIDLGIHCGQREVTDQNLDLARHANVVPVENWIDLLERNASLRLHHLSTAFVGGTRRGLFTEFDLDCGQQFHNAYERSKFEAETRLRESRVADRVAVYRPSHVLGCAATGEAFDFGGAYPLLATIAAASILPGDGRARIDFIPADYVASAMVALALDHAAGTFHLACGWETSLPVRDAVKLAAKGRDRRRGARLVPRVAAWPLQLTSDSLAFTTARDLLHQGPVFDTYLADRALRPLGVERPAPAQWLETATRHAALRAWKPRAAIELERPAVQLIEACARKFHRIGDVNVAFRDVGEGEPVVFLHGFSGAQAWDGVVERMAAGRRALVIETLGLGDTEAPASADYSLTAEAARVRGLLSALGISSAHVVGNDTGGLVAGLVAVRWPQCVRSLVLSDCDTHGPWPPRHIASAGSLGNLLKIPFIGRPDRERRMRLRRFLRSVNRDELAGISQLLPQLEVPAMVIWGADNTSYSPSWARTLYDTIPAVRRLELIPFAGISCHAERPDLFARHLAEFFEEVAPSVTTAAARAR